MQEAFVGNFTRRNELGAACYIYYHGEKVVDAADLDWLAMILRSRNRPGRPALQEAPGG